MGYLAIICLSFLFGTIFLNDFVKLVNFTLKIICERKRMRNQIKMIEKRKLYKLEKNKETSIQIEKIYSEQLDYRLRRMHLNLLRKYTIIIVH